MRLIVKKIAIIGSATLLAGYAFFIKSCTVIEKDLKGTQLIQSHSELMPEDEYYFVTMKYLYSKIHPNFMTGGSSIKIPVSAYGVNDKNGKIILNPRFVEDPHFVKVSEYGEDGKLHETFAWWTIGRVRSSRLFPFIEENYTLEIFTLDGKKYPNKNKKFCIVKEEFNAHLMDLKTRESVFYAYEMDWKNPTEIIYESINSGHNEIPKIEIKFIEKK